MWLLMLVFFSGPMQIERVEILEMHWSKKECEDGTKHAQAVGLPIDSTVGCVYLKEVKRATNSES